MRCSFGISLLVVQSVLVQIPYENHLEVQVGGVVQMNTTKHPHVKLWYWFKSNHSIFELFVHVNSALDIMLL